MKNNDTFETVLKVWTTKGFHGHWPVGTSAVVVAETATEAIIYLNDLLKKNGIGLADARSLGAVPMKRGYVEILNDGDY